MAFFLAGGIRGADLLPENHWQRREKQHSGGPRLLTRVQSERKHNRKLASWNEWASGVRELRIDELRPSSMIVTAQQSRGGTSNARKDGKENGHSVRVFIYLHSQSVEIYVDT